MIRRTLIVTSTAAAALLAGAFGTQTKAQKAANPTFVNDTAVSVATLDTASSSAAAALVDTATASEQAP